MSPLLDVDLDGVRSAVAALHGMAEQWRQVPVGGELPLDWPRRLRMPAPEPATAQRRHRRLPHPG
jgi:hypothetical protein